MTRLRPGKLQAGRIAVLVLGVWTAWQVGGANLLAALDVASDDDQASGNAVPGRVTPTQAIPSLERDPLVVTDVDPFKPVNFSPPASPPVEVKPAPALPPPKPVLPPLPYRYFGRMTGIDGKPVTYLARDNEIIPVHEKQVLDNVYRVEAVGEGAILLRYLPLDEKIELLAKQQSG